MNPIPVFAGEVPSRLKKLQRNERGYPVPWFVAWIDGKPDFRAMDGNKLRQAVQYRLCWTCGDPLGAYLAFVIGPMCAVNRTSSEPPSHRECAEFSAKFCPFLSDPERKRRETNLPPHKEAAGIGLKRNPGVALIWITKTYTPFKVPAVEQTSPGILFEIGDPIETLWYACGRQATRDEVMASFESGLPALQKIASEEGNAATAQLDLQYRAALEFVPA